MVGGKTAAWHLEVIISASPRLTSPSCNPLRLTKHAATTAPISIIVRFLFVSFDQWICYENRPYFPFVGVDVHRSGKWSHVARFTFINEPVRMSLRRSKAKKSLKCSCGSEHGEPVAASPLQALTTRQIFGIFYHLFSAESLWVRACSWSGWEDGRCKIHSIKCSKIVFLPQMPNIMFPQTWFKICRLQHICCVRLQSTVKKVERDLSSYNLYLLKNWFDAMPGISGAKSCSSPSQGPLAPPSLM